MARYRRNPKKSTIAISLGVAALAGGVLWYFLRRKPTPTYMAAPTPTLAQQAAAGPARPMTTAAMSSLATLATQLQTAAAGK